jgi:hypothetical protein
VRLVRRDREIARLPGQAGYCFRRYSNQHLGTLRGYKIADDAGQTRRTMVLAGQAHCYADCEQQAEVVEDCLARCRHRGYVEEIRLTETQ